MLRVVLCYYAVQRDGKKVSRENFHSKLLITLFEWVIEFMDLEIISTISIDWQPHCPAFFTFYLEEDPWQDCWQQYR